MNAKARTTRTPKAPAETVEAQTAAIVASDASKSAKIRDLVILLRANGNEKPTGAVAKLLGIRYQFARNVIVRAEAKAAKAMVESVVEATTDENLEADLAASLEAEGETPEA